MKKFKLYSMLFAAVCILLSSFPMTIVADDSVTETISDSQTTDNVESNEYVQNEVIVLTNYFVNISEYQNATNNFNGVPIIGIRKLFSAETEEEISRHIELCGNLFSYCITIDDSVTVDTAVETLNLNANVIVAEPNYIIELDDSSENILSVDSNARSSTIEQWNHTYLNMSNVWNRSFVGSSTFTIAVLDTGFVVNTDLEDNLNIYMSYDAAEKKESVTTTYNHGNFVTGIIGADYNDGVGIDGICQSVDIIPVKICLDGSSTTYYTYVYEGLQYAVEAGAKVINYSFEMSRIHTAARELITSAKVLFVTSSGNDGIDMSLDEGSTQKLHDDPYWIVVGSSDSTGAKAADSNYSSQYCDLFAPGVSIKSTNISGIGTGSGTSYAAPHVTAACALIMSHATHLTALQVKELIMSNVTVVEGFDDYCVSGGILNINAVVNALFVEDRGQYGDYTKGDINNNGEIDSRDYVFAKRIYFGTYAGTTEQINAADIDGDGVLEESDYLAIQNYYFGTYYFPPV